VPEARLSVALRILDWPEADLVGAYLLVHRRVFNLRV
jgi:hypothetical protein